jgi:hypothetical protein
VGLKNKAFYLVHLMNLPEYKSSLSVDTNTIMMSSKKNKMSIEDVQQLGTEKLCKWFKTQLDEDEWKDAELVIRKQDIMDNNFLKFTYNKWVSNPCNLGRPDRKGVIRGDLLA